MRVKITSARVDPFRTFVSEHEESVEEDVIAPLVVTVKGWSEVVF
jgi:hypothetical protein